jgi:hypothetical protein
VGGFHITPPSGECCLGIEACGEANAETGTCSLCSWKWCCIWSSAAHGVGNCAPTVGLVQHIGWHDPVGRHGDGISERKELQCFLSPREDLVGAVVRGSRTRRDASWRRKTCVQLWRSLCTKVAKDAWCDDGTGLRRAM